MACSQAESTYTDPTGGGATGGSSSGAGGTGGSSGSGGTGGTEGPAGAGGTGGSPTVPLERFSATLQGQTVSLRALDPVWILTCEEDVVLVQRGVNDAWVSLRDDRPDAINLLHAAHFLDGAYHSDCHFSNGCDHVFCEAFPEDDLSFNSYRAALIAREYVQVGQRGALTCAGEDAGIALDAGSDAGSDAGEAAESRLVPNIESRAPSAPLGVRVRYFRDSNCGSEAITREIAVE